ncbi:ABC transporter permease [Alphaproteobacteria bacterium]|jgi:general nucleoside transport system permease protein|nr:ABC transporter permease [Alphaproteobacteria bacterium]MBT5799720.1 ABC transporter permease [Alphaproteobacteria bacterium]MDA9816430.1 ABC transporter permease [Alphaproteobacteria bacterium]MDC3311134.1 ABC transporter permease [Alphaproteobacteria bacterium]
MADFWFQFLLALDSSIRVATPLILGAMAGIFSERSGIIDISLEGKMLMAAFVAAAVAYGTGSPWLGAIAAIIVSIIASLIHGFACIIHRGNQVISGLAINILASGLTVIIGIALFRQGGQTPTLPKSARFNSIELPFAQYFADNIPILGVVYKELISGHNILVWLALASVGITYYILFKTTFGLRLRAVGEKPEALDSAGISVSKMRFQAIIIAGILCGLAGVYLSTATGAGFVKEMTAGKGYIALAAMIFGKWRPVPALFACLMFGFLEAVAARVQGAEFPIIGEISSDLLLALPYVLTVVLLAGFIGGVSPPRAIGQPYIKER